MGTGTLTIYSASAGSGKTFRLAGAYLSKILKSRYSYRRILAVTFTNKAAAEMKNRVLDQLFLLASGRPSEYLVELMEDTGLPEERLRSEAAIVLNLILHDFSRFSIGTIDSFFQKLLRAFVREAGLQSGFTIELDHTGILTTAVDDLINSSAENKHVQKWLSSFVMANIDNEKSWNPRWEIFRLAGELFRENFRMLSAQERQKIEDKEFLLGFIKKMETIRFSFENTLVSFARKAMPLFEKYGLTDDMFYFKGNGIPGYLRALSKGEIKSPGSRVREVLSDPPKWSSGTPAQALSNAITEGLGEIVRETILFFDHNYLNYYSALAMLGNIYSLGILSDISRRIREINSENNIFLLSDAGEFLRNITKDDQAPFIYEKVGNIYENFFIDEFQDTSALQWENFSPLVKESIDRGYDNMVVGDIKQSIYRWRNSDWRILARMKRDLIDGERFLSRTLQTNYRSRSELIRFINSLFSIVPPLITAKLEIPSAEGMIEDIYAGAIQSDPGKERGGFVRISFIADVKDKDEGNSKVKKQKVIRTWEDIVLGMLPELLETIQDRGFRASDIGIIVRDGREGGLVLRAITSYLQSCSADKKIKYNYNIVSGDSLLIESSHAVSFILSALRVMVNKEDLISRAELVRFYRLVNSELSEPSGNIYSADLFGDTSIELPEGSLEFLESAGKMNLYTAIEEVIRFFRLGTREGNIAYLDSFLDLVLNFCQGTDAGQRAFLSWWETTGFKKAVALPATGDAARILTIHKAKGLEFKVVILPFISWNLDHKPRHQTLIWVKPSVKPFSELPVAPLRYSAALRDTVFSDDYQQEKINVHIDNTNLLYVALTRAKDMLFGFAPLEPDPSQGIAEILRTALQSDNTGTSGNIFNLRQHYDFQNNTFSAGTMPEITYTPGNQGFIKGEIYASEAGRLSVRLKLHGKEYFSSESEERINYGLLMHEILAATGTADDLENAAAKILSEGKVNKNILSELVSRLKKALDNPIAKVWFQPGINVLRECEIILPSGELRRPDRVVLMAGKVSVIDFKFAAPAGHHRSQVKEYISILEAMGYSDITGFLWYINNDNIITVK
jgi:ATP-dependent exoDNAse (exonuclease V) beta subunit